MRKYILIASLLLSGCYLGTGSPSPYTYWIKNGKKISLEEMRYCGNQIEPLLEARFLYLSNKEKDIGFIEFYNNHKEEAKEYDMYLDKMDKLLNQCFYDLGYRFKAPLYWCLAQDLNNTKRCMENMKYRN